MSEKGAIEVPNKTPIMLDTSPMELMVSYMTNVRFGDAKHAVIAGTAMLLYEVSMKAKPIYDSGPIRTT